jgi:hypothetical protein
MGSAPPRTGQPLHLSDTTNAYPSPLKPESETWSATFRSLSHPGTGVTPAEEVWNHCGSKFNNVIPLIVGW